MPFKICYVSSEVEPFAMTSRSRGLANTSKALPIALKETNQDIRLMMPKYKSINERKYVLREVIRLREVDVELGGKMNSANGKTAFLPNSKVHVYFLSLPEYFDRKGFYQNPQTKKDYPDNALRFAHFSKSVLETLKLLYWQPDIIHCSDWPTALIPFYLKTYYKDDDFFKNTRTVLTVHNFADQGQFPFKYASKIDIDNQYLESGQSFELKGKLNLLKGGLIYADVINTVSHHYAQEILNNPEPAHGLHELICSRKQDFTSILNGIDNNVWNPQTDTLISKNYDAGSLNSKGKNKTELCFELDLENDSTAPFVAIMQDFSDKFEINQIFKIIDSLLKTEARVILIGNGALKSKDMLQKKEKQNKGKFVYRERCDKRTAHLTIAGADIIFIPEEPHNENSIHLASLKYGTIPIALDVGILSDTITNFDETNGKGNGFTFSQLKQSEIAETFQRALKIFNDKKVWEIIRINAMNANFSWNHTVSQYLEFYDKALRK